MDSAGHVWVDGALARRAKAVAAGSIVRVRIGGPRLSDAVPDPEVQFEVVYEDVDLLVVNKPAGLVVHPARGHRQKTLVNGLLARPDFVATNADPRDPEGHLRPGIVHRLDKDTSGLLAVAKNAATREGLKELFARHCLERRYTAIVLGVAADGTYDTPFGRHPRNRLRFTSSLPADRPKVRRAITHVRLVETLTGTSVVQCRLETGRTHQIRVHLSHLGWPIAGDDLYGGRHIEVRDVLPPDQSEGDRRRVLLGRQALHAAMLGFVHPSTQVESEFQAMVPCDMAELIRLLRLRGPVERPKTTGTVLSIDTLLPND